MVLNKSKWDHKAKIQYLKKHNLTRPKPTPDVNRPKWSGKKRQENQGNSWLDESSDSEWDSEDEAVLNHFYPQIAEDNLSVENKKKLKQQIIKIVKQREAGDDDNEQKPLFSEKDGIYLGHNPADNDVNGSDVGSDHESQIGSHSEDEFALEIPDLETKLSEFVVSDLGKLRNRKMLKNKVLENLLDEYGLDSYSSTVKDTDYNSHAQKFRDVSKLSAADLHGFRIGESAEKTPKHPEVRALDEAELEEHRKRAENLQRAKFHQRIKSKFGDDQNKGAKVLEINNFNASDRLQMDSLNAKLTLANDKKSGESAGHEDDLDTLLGLTSEDASEGLNVSGSAANGDFLLETLLKAFPSKESRKPEGKERKPEEKEAARAAKATPASDSFLDDLLGI